MLTSLWTIVGLIITAVMLGFVPYAWRNRGSVFALRLAAIALLPAAFAMTGLLTLMGRIGRAVSSFVTHLVFSPVVWLGAAMLGAAVLLEVTARAVRTRGGGGRPDQADAKPRPTGSTAAPISRKSEPAAIDRSRRAPAADDEFADIEELLRRRGIK